MDADTPPMSPHIPGTVWYWVVQLEVSKMDARFMKRRTALHPAVNSKIPRTTLMEQDKQESVRNKYQRALSSDKKNMNTNYAVQLVLPSDQLLSLDAGVL